MRVGRALGAIAGAVIAAAALSAGSVAAHAELESTTPASGERLDASPPVIELRYTEDVQLVADPVRLLTQTGEEVDLPEASVDGAVVRVDVPPLADGGYVVEWQVVSDDGHPISGAFAFAVGETAPPAPGTVDGGGDDGTDVLWIWRAITYAGFALVLGVWAFVLLSWWAGRGDRGVGNLLTAGALVALVGSVGRVVAEATVLGIGVADTVDLRSGKAWWALVALSVLLLAPRPLLRSTPTRPPAVVAWALATVAVGLAIAYAGHGAAGRLAGLGTVLTIVHVGAASVWVGGLAALLRFLRVGEPVALPAGAAVATPDTPDVAAEVEQAQRWATVARFSTVALVAVAVVETTGIVQGIRQLEEARALVDSDYGRALLVKVAIVVVLIAVAAVSRRLVQRPGTDRRPLARLVGVEVALATLTLVATGWLAGESPVVEAEVTGPVTTSVTDPATGATAIVELDPGRTGPNTLLVHVESPGAPVQQVVLDLAPLDGSLPAVRLDALEVGAGHVVVDDVDIELAGTWRLTIEARLGEFDVATLVADFEIR